MKKVKIANRIAWLVFFLMPFLSVETVPRDIAVDIMTVDVMVIFVLFIVRVYLKGKEEMKPENVAARQEQEAARQAKKRAAALERSRQARLRAQSKIIVEVKLLGAGMTVQKSGGLGGFVVGSMIAGPVGGAIGASSKRNFYQRERFAVKYSDGRVEIEEVVQDSNRYKELMKYVKWEDIQ